MVEIDRRHVYHGLPTNLQGKEKEMGSIKCTKSQTGKTNLHEVVQQPATKKTKQVKENGKIDLILSNQRGVSGHAIVLERAIERLGQRKRSMNKIILGRTEIELLQQLFD
jgi:hypothetical protein